MFGRKSAGLIRTLREEVVNDKVPLSSSLRRAKVLASMLRNSEFKEWLRNETNGYSNGQELPDYRRVRSPALGTFSGPFGRMVKGVQLPTYNLPELLKPLSEELAFSHGIKELEALIERDTGDLRFPWPAEAVMLAREKVEMTDGSVLVEAYQPVTTPVLERIVDAVRSKLLDFVLELQELNPDILQSEEAIPDLPSDKVSQIFNLTIEGNNNVIASGRTVDQDVSQTISLSADILGLLDTISETLRDDVTLDGAHKRELIADVDVLRRELSRRDPREGLLEPLLATLGNVSSISGLVMQLTGMLG